jgi:hypothetical protein
VVLAVQEVRWDGWTEGAWLAADNLDLTPWAGQTVRLTFRGDSDQVNPTTFWVDDVTLETCPEFVEPLIFADAFETGLVPPWSGQNP